ncbi:hypothetical protein PBRA_007343 [Plasmodiophora brassicae]|nr:hypothetical protein PBRA_007343 [Plasmodiophora brassicae]
MSEPTGRRPGRHFSLSAVPLRSVTPGAGPDLFHVAINSNDRNATFKGFLLFAENGNGTRVGEWLQVAESRAKPMAIAGCDQGSTLTHLDSDDKMSGLTFTYKAPAPASAADSIKVRCGVVVSFDEWYVAQPVVLSANNATAEKQPTSVAVITNSSSPRITVQVNATTTPGRAPQ